MSCPHCHAQVPEERPHGGQCPACRRLFVRGGRVAYTELSPEFLRERIAALGQDGALRVTSLQLQWDARKRRPYPLRPLRPWWHVRPFEGPSTRVPVIAAVVTVAVATVAAAVHWSWSFDVIASAVIWALIAGFYIVTALAYVFHVIFELPLIAVRGPVRLVRRLAPDPLRVVLTPAGFTALARTVSADVVDEHGMAPPPAPEPARFAVLCPDPAVAACLWANDVGGRLGALVVVARRELRRGMPVLDLSRSTLADPPLTLMTQVLQFGREHADAGRTGFLSWPGSR